MSFLQSLICLTIATCSVFKAYTHQLVVVALFKNEAPYLKEWIEYHRLVGVDHFILLDNLSTDHWRDVLDPYIEEGLVEVINSFGEPDFKGFPAKYQTLGYFYSYVKCLGKARWITFIDIDEFLLPMKTSTVVQSLDEYYQDASGIYVNWRCFGTNHRYIEPGKPIITQLKAASNASHSHNAVGKSIIKVGDIEEYNDAHFWRLKAGKHYFDGSGRRLVYNADSTLKVPLSQTSKYIRINHYMHRDEKFFRERRLKRARDLGHSTHTLLEHYRSFNEDEDYAIINFLKTHHPEAYETFWNSNEQPVNSKGQCV